jgi:hypothetical protein
MLKKLRYFVFFILFGLSLVSCVVYRAADTLLPEPTATPIPKIKSILPLEAQAGNTNFIIVLGILIFLFIAIPIMLRYKDWRAS